jgi:serine/threonine protein phosphatase PrpC
MQVRFWAATHQGRTREHNEDNFLVDKKLNLFIVADGMGGHAAGEIASSVAVREVRRLVSENRDIVENYAQEESAVGRQEVLRLIEQAIQHACARIFEMAQETPDRRGMGTTLCMLLVAGRRGFIGHVGDSRIYLLRTGQVHQLTEDHSLVNELIKRGRLKPGDVFDSPYKNAVTRAVGVYESVEVDTLDFDILPGDNYLLCSDGLSCYLDNETTRHILGADNVKEIPDRFIELANNAGGKDNITSVVVRVQPEADESRNERMTEVRLKLDTLRAIPLFKYLSYKGLVKVMNITDNRRVPAGTLLFEEGSRGEDFYLILQGRVAIEKGGLLLAELGAGGHFGEMAMVDKSPRSATARVVEDSKLLIIQRQQFYEIMRRDPNMAVKLMWSFIQVLNTRLRLTNNELLSARDTIDVLRHHQIGGVVAEMPSIDPAVAAVAGLPVGVTDELIPGFLFADSEQVQTDPLLRLDPSANEFGEADVDDRPGITARISQNLSPPEPAHPAPPSPPPLSAPPEALEPEALEFESTPTPAPAPVEASAPVVTLPRTTTPPTVIDAPVPALSPPPADDAEARVTVDLARHPNRARGSAFSGVSSVDIADDDAIEDPGED